MFHNHTQPTSNERNGEDHQHPSAGSRPPPATQAVAYGDGEHNSAATTLAGLMEGMKEEASRGAGGPRPENTRMNTGESSSAPKKTKDPSDDAKKGTASGAGGDKPKPPRSCDTCRARKVKCVRPEGPTGEGSSRCQGCSALDIDCTYHHIARKPGRPNSFANAAKRASALAEGRSDRPTSTGPVRGVGGNYQNQPAGPVEPPAPVHQDPGSSSSHRLSFSHPNPPGSSTFSQPQLPSPFASTPSWYPSPSKLFGQQIPYGTGLSPPMVKDGPTPNGGMKSLGNLESIFDSPSSTGSATQAGPSGMLHYPGSISGGGGMVDMPSKLGTSTVLKTDLSTHQEYGESSRSTMSFGGDGSTGPPRWSGPDAFSSGRHSSYGTNAAADATLPPILNHGSASGSGGGGGTGHSVSFSLRPGTAPLARVQSQEMDPQTGTSGSYSVPSFQGMQPSLQGPSTGDSITSGQSHAGPPNFPLQHHHHPFAHIQIEDVTSWATVSFFVSLYLRHFHALVPLVHRPTFTHAIAMRQDRDDVEFRAFLLSMVCYLISQSPKSRMIEHFSQSELERLQSRCHRASRLLQTRSYKTPSLTHILTLMFDYFYSASAGRTAQGMAVLSEAISLAYVMGLNDDERTAGLGLDDIEVQMRRRTFWLLYAIDITEASAGSPIHMHEFEGVCAYPDEVDDDLITSQGLFRQPISRTSLLVGFVCIMKLFRIHAECLIRHRTFVRIPGSAGPDSVHSNTEWITEAHERIQVILDGLPPALQGDEKASEVQPMDLNNAEIFGTERANILITAASVKFSLYDFKSLLNAGGEQVAEEQETVSRAMYNLLASIPLDHLAANGESMRGKVLRIIAALLTRGSTPGEELSSSVKDWWDMYSLVQFVQIIPRTDISRLPSREASPAKEGES